MSLSKIQALHDKIELMLGEGQLHSAFKTIRNQLTTQADSRLIDRLNHLEETYKYLIHYLVEGYDDTGRDKMISDITNELYSINDMLLSRSELPTSENIYYSTLRFENLRKASLKSRLNAYREAASKAELSRNASDINSSSTEMTYEKEEEEALASLFSFVWTMFGNDRNDYRELKNALLHEDLPNTFHSVIISALLLGSLHFYDSNALDILIDLYESSISPRISAQALTAIFLIISKNAMRVRLDKKISSRLSLWQDALEIYPRLREILMSLLRARDTERINNKMKNELIPEIMKMRPEIINKLKNASEEMDIESLEENPEWEDLLNKNGLADKLKELTDIQLEGGDVMMMAFSNLKNFPFFNSVPNWFFPFSSNHSQIKLSASEGLQHFSEILDMEGVMCDSDKFSFALSLKTMPKEQRDMISLRMNTEIGQLKEIMNEKKDMPGFSEFNAEVTRYIRNLYRFFKLYRKKGDFTDPFNNPIDFQDLPFIGDILDDNDILNLVGEFYFKRGYYAEALPIMLKLETRDSDASLLWEKIGYCYNSLGNFSEALKWYKKAELINPDSKWLIKKLALVSRLLGRYGDAAEYYSKALEKDPDNYKLLISAGNCLLEDGQTKEALQHYYHAEYVRPDKVSTSRAIAWGELLNGNFDKSIQYYNNILSGKEISNNDYLNAGHAAYLNKDLKKAVSLYVKSASGSGLEEFEKSIKEDFPVIVKAGGNARELTILLDKVKYEIG